MRIFLLSLIVCSCAIQARATQPSCDSDLYKQREIYLKATDFCQASISGNVLKTKFMLEMHSLHGAIQGLSALWKPESSGQMDLDTRCFVENPEYWRALDDCLAKYPPFFKEPAKFIMTTEIIMANSVANGLGVGAGFIGVGKLIGWGVRGVSSMPWIQRFLATHPKVAPSLKGLLIGTQLTPVGVYAAGQARSQYLKYQFRKDPVAGIQKQTAGATDILTFTVQLLQEEIADIDLQLKSEKDPEKRQKLTARRGLLQERITISEETIH